LKTIWQLVASLVVFYIPLVQQVANLHVVIRADSNYSLPISVRYSVIAL